MLKMKSALIRTNNTIGRLVMFDGKNFSLAECILTEIDGEKILFSESKHKIIVLNTSASLIWNVLRELESDTRIISIDAIVHTLENSLEITQSKIQEVYADVEDFLKQCCAEGFLVVQDCT